MHLLFHEVSADDAIHDVVFKISDYLFPAHHYIIAINSSKLDDLITASVEKVIELSNVNPDIFKQLLLFIYTGTCDLLKPGKCLEKFKSLSKRSKRKEDSENENESIDKMNMSAFEYYKNEKSKCKSGLLNENEKDPVHLLQEAAKRFGVKTLQKLLDNVYFDDGCIVMKREKHVVVKPKFNRKEFPELLDVILKTKEKKEVPAHKCILAARLEYFNNLFSLRWNENSSSKEISLPFAYNVLDQLIEFLYMDDLTSLHNEDIDHVCNLLVVSDQLFVLRLKEICECTLSTFLTLKNVVQMLSFSSLYNAEQLKIYCMEFICTNLAAILELRSLEFVNEELLHDLAEFYCKYNPIMQQRIITPYSYAPTDEVVSAAGTTYQILLEDSDNENDIKSTPKSQKKRSRSRKSTSLDPNHKRGYTISDSIDEFNEFSTHSENSRTTNKTESPLQIEHNSTSEDGQFNKVQTRLRAIAFAQEKINCDNVVTEYTKLPLKSGNIEISLTDFPKLENRNSTGSYSKSPNKPEKFEVKHKMTKLSQKQRKRLSSESSLNAVEPCSPILSESPKNPWKICTEFTNVSPIGSPSTPATMDSIIIDEKRQKENFVKMKTKLLVHTQMEDKAIEDLQKFYNVDSVFDEIVSISRVQIGSVASPVWVHLNKIK